ncbi:MAG: cytochrome C [candidate division Zixibacteria bacterium]|nr:cytochrome C [candidate division Zixibacteria bacterium]
MINRSYKSLTKSYIVACLSAIVLLFSVLFIGGCVESKAVEIIERADVITIDDMKTFGDLERETVLFPHDLHTDALAKEGKSCETCHTKNDKDKYIPLFNRTGTTDYETVFDQYHTGCIDCHKERDPENSGPVVCGDCHRRQPVYQSSWSEIGFNKSLHFRHAEANMEKCEHCHHVYDENSKQLVYAKNQESSCRDCHKQEKIDNKIPLEQAAHYQCFGCHLVNDDSGPTTCAGCHDAVAQTNFKVVENPKRLFREQPDKLFLTVGENEITDSKMSTVPFWHISHEEYLDDCRTCHHETMKACKECHLLIPTDEAVTQVTIQQAMHDVNSKHSCIGCHDEEKSRSECAGCHSMMEQGKLSEQSCTICHSGPKPDAAVRMTTSKMKKQNPVKISKLTFRAKDIPDTVFIGTLSDKYEPAVFPHKKIIDVLAKHVKDSKIAEYFHGSEDVLCQGCHHHSPAGEIPPLCESCHNQPFNESDIHKPGLYGAFHRQCIGCHQEMNITEPSDCVGCHAQKTGN